MMGLLDDMPVTYPWMRANLKGHLETLADVATQERIMRDGPTEDTDHWFFDSMINDFPHDLSGLREVALRDDDELEAVEATRRALDAVEGSLRPAFDDEAWYRSPHWPEVVRCASLAYALMVANDEVPAPPSREEVVQVLGQLAAGDVSWHDAANWVSHWMVWGRRDVPEPIWTALYRISGEGEAHHRRSDKEAREDALRWRNELRQS